jgi:hypothetical protein
MMRRAFSMMMAVVVMVVMLGVSAMVFSLSNKVVFATTTQYHKEQAILLAKSYTEYTLMAVTANLGTTGGTTCLNGVRGDIEGIALGGVAGGDVESGMGYRVETRVSYIGNGLNCTNVLNTAAITRNGSPSIVIDVYVSYRDTSMHQSNTSYPSPWMTYHRRTLQKI